MLTLEIFKKKKRFKADETGSFLAALQKDLNNVKRGVSALIELPEMSDKEVYKKYQYCSWNEITEMEYRYLKKRYKLEFSPAATFGNRPIRERYIGQTFEKYDLQHKPVIEKVLYDFSRAQLLEMINAITKVYNEKKETDNV